MPATATNHREAFRTAHEALKRDVNFARTSEAADAARAKLALYDAAALRERGALVEYTNTRARAKFARGRDGEPALLAGTKVPVGTTGTVIWVGSDSFSGSDKFGVKTAAGDVFFSVATNFAPEAADAWSRLALVTGRESAFEATRARLASEGRLPSRDQWVTLKDGRLAKVFWVGQGRGSGAAEVRVGVKLDGATGRNDDPLWGTADDLVATTHERKPRAQRAA